MLLANEPARRLPKLAAPGSSEVGPAAPNETRAESRAHRPQRGQSRHLSLSRDPASGGSDVIVSNVSHSCRLELQDMELVARTLPAFSLLAKQLVGLVGRPQKATRARWQVRPPPRSAYMSLYDWGLLPETRHGSPSKLIESAISLQTCRLLRWRLL